MAYFKEGKATKLESKILQENGLFQFVTNNLILHERKPKHCKDFAPWNKGVSILY